MEGLIDRLDRMRRHRHVARERMVVGDDDEKPQKQIDARPPVIAACDLTFSRPKKQVKAIVSTAPKTSMSHSAGGTTPIARCSRPRRASVTTPSSFMISTPTAAGLLSPSRIAAA
jgi:hypothetical protein